MPSVLLPAASSNGLVTAEIRDFPSRINRVTMAQVKQVIQELIQPDKLVIVTAGPGETIPKGN
jgi:zinc protease